MRLSPIKPLFTFLTDFPPAKFCDEIAVFDGGTIVQFGNHQQLVADTDGLYYQLWMAQAKYYTKQPAE